MTKEIKSAITVIAVAIVLAIINFLLPDSGNTPADTAPTAAPAATAARAATPAPGATVRATSAGNATNAPVTAATPRPGTSSNNRNLALGNPSDAVHDAGQPNNYLIERPQYVLSYNRDRGIANWVSWQVTSKDFGQAQRSNEFVSDTSLPSGWARVTTDDYTGSGYDRGHLCPSADRTGTQDDNDATFIMTNIMPQAPDNNRGTWEQLESYARSLVDRGNTLYVVAGSDGTIERLKNKVTVPAYTWKVIVVAPKDGNIAGISANSTVLAVRIPNDKNAKLGDWGQYRVSVATIEQATGLHFFTNLPPAVQTALKSRIDPAPKN